MFGDGTHPDVGSMASKKYRKRCALLEASTRDVCLGAAVVSA